MDWTDLTITIPVSQADAAAAIAEMATSRGLYIEDYSTLEDDLKLFGPVEIIDDELLSKDRDTAKIHVYVSPEENPAEYRLFLEEKLGAAGVSFTIGQDEIKEEDWANNWKQFFKPMNVGRRLRLIPTWELDEDGRSPEGIKAKAEGRKRLVIDPGMAFGSGQHETTRLCLTLLEEYVREGIRMLDVGCGSGILAIAGLLLGAESAVGVDIDPLSVKIAGENAVINGVRERLTLAEGDLASKVSGRFSLITANIVADVIIRLLPDAAGLLEDGGAIIVSGIIDTRLADVETCAAGCGLSFSKILTERGWCAGVLTKKQEAGRPLPGTSGEADI